MRGMSNVVSTAARPDQITNFDVAIQGSTGQACSVTETDDGSTTGGTDTTATKNADLRDLPTADEIAFDDISAHRLRVSPLTIMVGLILVTSFGVWLYAYSGLADRPPPDVLETDTFANQAEPICAATLVEIGKIPDASLTETAAERSAQLLEATELFAEMVDDLGEVSIPNESDRDAALREEWLTHWGILLDDRVRYADELLVNEDARFLVSDLEVSESPERRLGRFAIVNNMESCGTPKDAG